MTVFARSATGAFIQSSVDPNARTREPAAEVELQFVQSWDVFSTGGWFEINPPSNNYGASAVGPGPDPLVEPLWVTFYNQDDPPTVDRYNTTWVFGQTHPTTHTDAGTGFEVGMSVSDPNDPPNMTLGLGHNGGLPTGTFRGFWVWENQLAVPVLGAVSDEIRYVEETDETVTRYKRVIGEVNAGCSIRVSGFSGGGTVRAFIHQESNPDPTKGDGRGRTEINWNDPVPGIYNVTCNVANGWGSDSASWQVDMRIGTPTLEQPLDDSITLADANADLYKKTINLIEGDFANVLAETLSISPAVGFVLDNDQSPGVRLVEWFSLGGTITPGTYTWQYAVRNAWGVSDTVSWQTEVTP